MSTNYPGAIDNYGVDRTDNTNTKIPAADVNNLRHAIVAIENELGVNPKGNELSVKARLDKMLDASTYTANDVLTKLKTVDGDSSGLDADLFDGKHLVDICGVSSKGLFSANPYLSKTVSTTTPTAYVTTVGTTPILCPYVGTVDLSADFTNIGGEVYIPACSVTTQSSGSGTYTVDLLINDVIRATQTVIISGTNGTFNAVTLPASYFLVGNNTIKKRFTYVSDYRSNILTATQSSVYIMPKIIIG